MAAPRNHALTALFAAGAVAVLAASFLGWGLVGFLSTALLAVTAAWGFAHWRRPEPHAESDLAAVAPLDDVQRIAGLGDWTCDLATGVLAWSPQIYRMLGRDPALPPPDLAEGVALFENGANATADAFFKAQETGERQTYELRARLPGGETATFEVIVLSVHDNAGAVVGMRGTFQDISRHKAVEEQLALAKLAAENSSRAKSDFLATMSHEIRTPLNGMLGILELVGLMSLNPELRNAFESVRDSGKSLQRIIDDILDFSKVEAGKLDIRPEPTSLVELADAIQRSYAGSASRHGLEMRVDVDPGISPAVLVDGLRLRQILGNFLSNAIKFTPAGHVELRIRLLQREGDRETLRFEVEDTGIGISPERQQRLFQPFEQAGNDHASRVGGTGLGLVISRRLAELMGGAVGMASVLGVGTTMSLDLAVTTTSLPPQPRDAPAPAEIGWQALPPVEVPSVEQATLQGMLVLVVDDHPINRIVMRRQLNTLGYAAEEVESGAEALERWRTGRFALILTDCNMPHMSGYELSRRVRELEVALGCTRTPIVACSANVIQGTREACLAAGMDDYIPKPTELLPLGEIMNRWLPRLGEAGDPAPGPMDERPMRVFSKGDPAAARKALDHFRRINDRDADLLQEAAHRGDMASIAHLAHRIKGACGFIGATGLERATARLEQAGRSGDGSIIEPLMNDFRRELEGLNVHLDAQRRH